jgi:iron complex outermembrane receptor protein
MYIARKAFWAVMIVSASQMAVAQDSTLQLDNVIITATLSAQHQKESGRNIIAINGESFSKLPVHSVDELLRYLPGIEVQQRGPQGSQSDIVIRGGTFQQVLVIIDGIKLNDPLTGHFSMYAPIHPSDIERVEILKGAASAIWGSEAVGGVVNIITKTFTAGKSKNEIKAKATAGQYGLFNGEAYVSYTKKKSALAAGILSNNATGQSLRGTNGYFHLTTANISFAQLLANDWRLSFRSAADFRKFNAQNFYTTFASDTANEKVDTWWNHLNLQKKTTKGVLNFDAGYKKLRDQYWFRPAAIPNDNKTNLFSSQLYYSADLNKQHGYTSGLQLLRKEIRSNDRGNHSLWHAAAYSIFRHKLKNGFYLNESLRLDWDESYGWILSPQLNIAWAPSRFTVRGSVGRSFRDADFTERYNNYNKQLVTSGRIGNPDLKAEQSWNAELGADYNFSARFRVSGTFFYRDHSNLIDWANTPYAEMPRKSNLSPTGNYALAKNVEEVKTTGAEIDIIYNEKIGRNASLLATAGITWLKSVNDDPVPSFYISSHARFLANFSLAWTMKSFSVSINGVYKKRDEQKAAAISAAITPDYFVINTRGAYTFKRGWAKCFIQADNQFNKRYSDLLGAAMPGRWLSGGIEIALRY